MNAVADRLTTLLRHRRTGDVVNDAILDAIIGALGDAAERLGIVAFGNVTETPESRLWNGLRLAVQIDSSRAAWLDDPAEADPYDRLVVFETPGTRAALDGLATNRRGAWHGRTWSYLNVMAGNQWGLTPTDDPNGYAGLSVDGDRHVRMAFDFPNQIAMDVRDPAWQNVVVSAALAQINAYGHRGVWLDDVNPIPGLLDAADGSAVAAPTGWSDGMIALVAKIRALLPDDAELIINTQLVDIAWNGAWVDWPSVLTNPIYLALRDLDVIWNIERGFSDPNIKGGNEGGLRSILADLAANGRRFILEDESGADGPYQRAQYLISSPEVESWLQPSVPLADLGAPDVGGTEIVPPAETGAPGDRQLTDPRVAPIWALAHAGLYTGAILPGRRAGETETAWLARARDAVVYPLGIKRGTHEAVRRAVQPLLTGTKTVVIVDQSGGDPYSLLVRTITSETPDPAAVQLALEGDFVSGGHRGAIRAELKLDYVVSDEVTFAEATLRFSDLPPGTITAENVTREDVT
jgi:hypothetical protein